MMIETQLTNSQSMCDITKMSSSVEASELRLWVDNFA